MRKIIHIDMDAFFASVEQHDNPGLRGLPIAVGGDSPRSVVCTASYEARRFGVRSAMPMSRARRLCRDLVVVPVRFARYKEVSAQVHEIFREYTDLIEPLSIDEAFLDVTVNRAGITLARDVAIEIKRKIFERTGLTASAGVSYCKFLAKIASDYRKPDGLCTVHPSVALDFIAQLPVEDFWGVGPKTAERMHSLGIHTGADLRSKSLHWMLAHFGKTGRIYHDFARGIDDRPVVASRVRKSVGCEETYEYDIADRRLLDIELRSLAQDLETRLERASFEGMTLTLKIKYADFTISSRSHTLDHPVEHDASAILAEAIPLLDVSLAQRSEPIRLMGLSVSNPMGLTRGDHSSYPRVFDPDTAPYI